MTAIGPNVEAIPHIRKPAGAWRSFWALAALIALMSAGILLRNGDFIEQLRLLIRTTARTSAGLFLIVFTASAIDRLFPNAFSTWALLNRRQLGLAFAFSHTVHAIAIYNYWKLAPELFWHGRSVAANMPGAFGYLAIVTLVATSNDAAVRKLTFSLWKRIHTIAIWVIFAVFFIAWGKRIPAEHIYAIPFALFTAAALIRLISNRYASARTA